MTRARALLLVVALGGSLVAARAAVPAGGPQRHEVRMRSVSYAPGELRLAVGDTVVWRNTDIVRHDAVRPGLFDTGELQSGDSARWVASDTGTFAYRCTIHARMRGRLIVGPE
ncbi:MAG TPA: hypothetical protein VFV33_17415 [Gemmatimonadaceae bacterium]|nr:hypothetical protein [Gemmatimonadaceae bacterium]